MKHSVRNYSLELWICPDEFLNCDLKAEIAKRAERREKGALKTAALKVLRSLQKQPKRIAKYFNAESIQYAQ